LTLMAKAMAALPFSKVRSGHNPSAHANSLFRFQGARRR
jgi:hypothetical protein